MSVPAARRRLGPGGTGRLAVMVVVVVLRGVAARRAGGGGGEGDGVQAPGGADAHPPGGFLLDFHAPPREAARVYDELAPSASPAAAPPAAVLLQLRAEAQAHQLQALHQLGAAARRAGGA